MLSLRSLLAPAFAVNLLLFVMPARASEGIFSYTYSAETTPAGQWEYEQKNFFRSGKARGNYTALDVRNEVEFGITNKLQAAFYLNSTYLNSKNQYDPEDVGNNLPDQNGFEVNGVSVELMYRILSPYSDGWGLAVYLEPEIAVRDHMTGRDRIERSVEGRLILQKNFLGDQVITAFNLMLEPEWEREDSMTHKELWVQLSAGGLYQIKPNWFAGLEMRNHMEFIEMNLQNQEHSAYFAGPVLHYGAESYWWTVTVLPQIYGWPRDLGTGADGKEVGSSYAHLGQHEKLEIAFSFGIPLGGEGEHHHEH